MSDNIKQMCEQYSKIYNDYVEEQSKLDDIFHQKLIDCIESCKNELCKTPKFAVGDNVKYNRKTGTIVKVNQFDIDIWEHDYYSASYGPESVMSTIYDVDKLFSIVYTVEFTDKRGKKKQETYAEKLLDKA